MGRPDLERLSREELIELVLRLQRPAKTSRTSSKPPSTDRKERRKASRPGGAKPGHEGHSRILSEAFDRAIDHRPDTCTGCCAALPADLVAETVSEHDTVELPPITPVVERHRRLAVRCPSCGMRVTAALPDAAKGTPFGADPCDRDLSEDLPGVVLRTASGGVCRSVRSDDQPGRSDEHAPPCAGAFCRWPR